MHVTQKKVVIEVTASYWDSISELVGVPHFATPTPFPHKAIACQNLTLGTP